MKRGRDSGEEEEDYGSVYSEDDDEEEEIDYSNIPVDELNYQEIRYCLKQRGVANPKGKKVDLQKQLLKLREEADQTKNLRLKHNLGRTNSSIAAWSLGLNDDVMLQSVLPQLDAKALASFSSTCKAAYVLVNNESLWDKIYQERFGDGGGDISSKKLGKAAMVFAKNLPPTARGKLKYMLKLNEEKCVQCGNIFYEMLNHAKACNFHKEAFAPKNQWAYEDMLWMCCGGEEEDEIGCCSGWHSSNPRDKTPGVNYDYWY